MEGAWSRGKKPKFRPLGTFLSNTMENKESLRQDRFQSMTRGIQKETVDKGKFSKILSWWIYERDHIFNAVEIAWKLAGNWHHLFQRLFLLVFLLTSIKWGLSIWKQAYKWDLGSPRKVASLGVSEAFYMVEFLFLKTPGHHVSKRPRDLKETRQKNEVNCKFEIWFETRAFKTKHSMPCLEFFF